MKRIIIFCDGTWNSADQKEGPGGQRCPTNVTRLFEATKHTGFDKIPQIALYIAGVGADKWERISGGGFGKGISKNIQEAYRFIVSNYEPGDDLYLFGFSRGAYTARSIVGMVDNVGILRRDQLHLQQDAYDHYRNETDEWKPGGEKAVEFRKNHCHDETRIAFLGVWDTVGALGAPFGALLAKITDILFHTRFHVVDFGEVVEHAYHAMAIDEKRWPFRPTPLMLQTFHQKRCEEAAKANEPPPYEEKWFPGVHSNVGGGYPRTGLSDCALEWMIERAERVGLGVERSRLNDPQKFAPNLKEQPEDSMTIIYRALTIGFVYLFKPVLKIIWPADAHMLANVNWKGEYTRIIDNQLNVAKAVEAHPGDIGYAGSLSPCAIEKLAIDPPDYRPKNVDL